ncbi:restriction endonuclease [Komagataeibacter europaeus NBRC 3261]|uniref:Restriction endonuclease n=2 Tax=Komagataeibacter europaeus TaxID=33995 RepID=A0A0D6PZ90_KOMEU|nr:restriction endonuclease [Komagataeibacter europaeus NBRC 3261]
MIENAAGALEADLKEKLLARILEETPEFFEHLIIDLLLAMGYGGSRRDAGQHVGGSGDGGVDGLIHEDQLGLDSIYLQAKRYQPENRISPAQVQGFIGALHGKNAQKGVFITTSTFTTAAREAASHISNLRVILIDGEALADLLLRFNVGVRVAHRVEVKKIDLDYFSPETSD